jgi:phage baseplate assembly protein W
MATELSALARDKIYSDLDFALRMNPVTGDAGIKKDIEAVKQSVLNILSTNRGERPFMPDFGGNIRAYLFENVDPITVSLMEEEIRLALGNYEPRVRVISVDVEDLSDNNAINIRLELEILSPANSIITVEFVVERLR